MRQHLLGMMAATAFLALGAAAAPAQDLAIEAITLETAGEAEVFCIDFNGEYIPEPTGLEQGNLRIFFDVWGLNARPTVAAPAAVGALVQKVRTSYEPAQQKFRAVLDLAGEHDYRVEQTYFKETDRYCLSVRQRGPGAGQAG